MRRLPWILSLISLGLIGLVFVSTSLADDLTAQEKKFLAAEQALARNNLTAFRQFAPALKDYPLYPYLQYEALRRQLHNTPSSAIELFLTTYAETPLAARLRNQWLLLLGQQKNWSEFLHIYDPQTQSVTLQCLCLQALMSTGQSTKAFSKVPDLWLSGTAQPSTCTPVFSAWINSGHLTRDLLVSRFRLALQDQNGQLAKSLLPYFSKSDRTTAELWLSVFKNPSLVTQKKFVHQSMNRPALLAYGLARLAHHQPDTVLSLWPAYQANVHFSQDINQRMIRSIGVTLARQGRSEALSWLLQVKPEYTTLMVQEWRIRSSLRAGNWRVVTTTIGALPEQEQARPAWQYWQARALAQQDQQRQARAIYEQLSKMQGYYGFLAQAQLGDSLKVQSISTSADRKTLKQVENLPGVQRAYELLRLQRYADARREWQFVTKTLNQQQLEAAAQIAAQWGWYDRSLTTAQQADQLQNLALAFPLGYEEQVLNSARAESLDPAWVFGIIRQESAFMADIASYVGALGLMQLMPGTALDISRVLKRPFKHNISILDTDLNIRFGSYYLKRLYTQYHHPALATAAYNAGPGAVHRWLPKEGTIPLDIWVDTIPFSETRGYVKNVMAFTVIYQKKLGEKPDLSLWLQPIRP